MSKITKGGEIDLESAEVKILGRHRFYGAFYGRKRYLGPISERILTPEFVEPMRIRNQKIDRFPETVEYLGAYLDRAVRPKLDRVENEVKARIRNHPCLAVTAGVTGVLVCVLLYRRASSKTKQAV